MLTAVLTCTPEGRFEMHDGWDAVPAGRRWEAIRYEHKGKARDGGTLTYYVASSVQAAERLAQGRAVFVEAELRAVRDHLRTLTDEQVLEWLQEMVDVKTLFTGAAVSKIRAGATAPESLITARYLGHDGEEIDLTPGEATPLLVEPPRVADPPPLPEGL